MKTILLVALLSLYGCAAIPLTPGAEEIMIAPDRPEENCKFLGEVIGNQGDFFTGSFTSNENLEIGAKNTMKNKALALGANYIQLLTTRAGNTAGSFTPSASNFEQTNVVYSGNAFYCPNL